MGKRGRPLGWRKRPSTDIVIGTGDKRFEFPIVRNGNVNKYVTKIYVNEESFGVALVRALRWALEYSEKQRESSNEVELEFWPLVKYRSISGLEKRYVRKIDLPWVYTESKDYMAWVPLVMLQEVA